MGVKLTDLAALVGAANTDQIYIEDASEANDANKAKSITLSELAKLLSPTYRVVAFEEFRGTVTSGSGANVNISPRSDDSHENLGPLGIGGDTLTLPPGKKYLLIMPMRHSATQAFVSLRSSPATGSQRAVDFWEQTHTRYYNTSERESFIFNPIDLTNTNVPEEVVLHVTPEDSTADFSTNILRRHALLIIESA